MTTFRLIHSGICSLLGYSAFVAFIILNNYPSAVLGIISGAADNISFFLHYLRRNGELRLWYAQTDLRQICRLGIVIATTGLLNLGYHTTIQVMLKKPMLPIPQSSVISIVWSCMVLKSGVFLMYNCIRYQNLDEERLIDEENEENVETDAVASTSIREL